MTSALKDAVEKNPRIAKSIKMVFEATDQALKKDGCSFEGTGKSMDDLVPGCVSVAEHIPEQVLELIDPEPLAILVMSSQHIVPSDHKQIYALIFNTGTSKVAQFVSNALDGLEAIKE